MNNGQESSPVPAAPAIRYKLDLNERSDGAPEWIGPFLKSLSTEVVWRYMDRSALEQLLALRFGLDPQWVFATNGGDEGIAAIFGSHPPEQPLWIPRPTFSFYEEQAVAWELQAKFIPAKEDLLLDLDRLEEQLADHPGGLVVLVRPNNPTGESPPLERMTAFLHCCRRHETRVLLDEAYAEFAADHMVDFLQTHPGLIILRTFSKAFGLAGLRIGYLLGNPMALDPLRKKSLPYNISSISLAVAEQALAPDSMAEMERYASQVKAGRDRLFARLRKWGMVVSPSQANFLLLKLGPRRCRFVAAVLRSRGIAVRCFSRPDLSAYLRIGIPTEIKVLSDALALALKPQLLCLDVDGCLVDTEKSFDAVVKQVVSHFACRSVSSAKLKELRDGGGFNDDNRLAHELIRRAGVNISLKEVCELFRKLYLGDVENPGLNGLETAFIRPELLSRLQNRLPLALVTGRNREELVSALNLLKLPSDFPAWTVDDVALGKPDPEGIFSAGRRYAAERVWMVGDNVDDMAAAIAAGALPIGIDPNGGTALWRAGAVAVLEHIDQIGALL